MNGVSRNYSRLGRSFSVLAPLLAVLLVVGCASEDDDRVASERAQKLVAEAKVAGLDSNVTVDNAEALYGDSAASVCDVFEGGLTSAEEGIVAGNPSGRRPKLVTTDAAEYGRLVVKVYCPELLPEYDEVTGGLRLADSTE